MHIRFNRSLRGDYGRAKPGDVKLVTKEIGKSLIARGLADEVDGPEENPEAGDDAKPAKGRTKPDPQ